MSTKCTNQTSLLTPVAFGWLVHGFLSIYWLCRCSVSFARQFLLVKHMLIFFIKTYFDKKVENAFGLNRNKYCKTLKLKNNLETRKGASPICTHPYALLLAGTE